MRHINWAPSLMGGSSSDVPEAVVKKGYHYGDKTGTYDLFSIGTTPNIDICDIAVEGLANWIRENLVGLTVLEEWPYGNQQLKYPSVTLFSGRPKRMPLMPEIISQTDPDDNNQIVANEVVAEYDFSIQLDLWAKNKLERKQWLSKILTAFNAQEMDITGQNNPDGLTLVLSNYFNMPVRYEVDYHQHKDDEQAAERQERRETISVLVNLREIRQRTYYAMRSIETHINPGTTEIDVEYDIGTITID